MLRLLLDEHISPTVAQQVRMRNPAISITSVREWRGGRFLGEDDDILLKSAHAENLTLVTYDQQTIRPMLEIWGAEDTAHSGVVFVSSFTIASRDFGGLVRALEYLWHRYQDQDWLNRVDYLESV